MINMDGFILSHMFEPIELMQQEDVDAYLPPYQPKYALHPDEPVTMGAYAMPALFTEAKKAQEDALLASYPHILQAWKSWEKLSGRSYHPVETFCSEDAETLFITMGSRRDSREAERCAGRVKSWSLKLLWRPFPLMIYRAIGNAQRLIVPDRVALRRAVAPSPGKSVRPL